ncbi:HelD family protein [Aquipuribacter sp. MA13-6]|uniref:HelD family protein n=1 Tax=unclassified Aquipuribacter TaxID=2635084 RepID=UPI003EE9D739
MTDLAVSPAEHAERQRLEDVMHVLGDARERLGAAIDDSAASIQGQKAAIWENQRDMDFAEKANLRGLIDVSVVTVDNLVEAHRRVERLLVSPYFGRVDFHASDRNTPAEHYIGLHSFRDPRSSDLLVHDWRAPVSSLYYDYEHGTADYESPEGTRHGEITGKRQYKIVDGHLEYMVESELTIGDEVLQRELSRSADDKMKNIVATIQREQNSAIRDEQAEVLILQGVAGSGKTSIALHRVAFLLYRFRDTLSARNVMILSPNKVFGDYISRVLPELGEEQIAETQFDAIARRYLTTVTDYQTFNEQVTSLLERVDDAATERMRHKATPEFLASLEDWVASTAEDDFTPVEIEQRGSWLPQEWVAESWAAASRLPLFARLERLADLAVPRLKASASRWSASDTTAVRRQVRAMFPHTSPLALYKAFYDAPEQDGLFVPLGKKKVEYSDVFPLVLTILLTTRQDGYGHVRHLLVDEMQDYTPVQYAVLRRLFSCRMTILGDAAQSVNPFSSSSLATIHAVFPEARCLELCTSYRSTTEITAFSQGIRRNDRLVPVDRHGPEPEVVACVDEAGEREHLVALVRRLQGTDHVSIGVVCRTVARAQEVHDALVQADVEATLLDHDSTEYSGRVVVTSAHIAKGLEFDAVVVPHVSADHYSEPVDRSMLYIACTRAMHELYLTHAGERSPVLPPAA